MFVRERTLYSTNLFLLRTDFSRSPGMGHCCVSYYQSCGIQDNVCYVKTQIQVLAKTQTIKFTSVKADEQACIHPYSKAATTYIIVQHYKISELQLSLV